MELKNKETYKYPMALTQQFRFCGNPFRLDFYKGCDFGCKYCFANARGGGLCHTLESAKFEIVENYFKKAFDSDKESKNITIELLRHKVPLHIGGMSDPFQTREWSMHLNYKMIELSNKYNYPLIFSTKTDFLPDEYYAILNPKLHAFQVSIMGYDDDFIKKYETNTSTAKERIAFVQKLRDKGFWCSVRLQPLVDMEQARKLCNAINGVASYVTIEHLKIPTDNKHIRSLFQDEFDKEKYYRPSSLRNYELKREYKEQNIKELMEILTDTKVGVGDNDCHYLSQSRCCCGVDTIGEEFNNYLKYNQTYFSTSKDIENEVNNIYTPKNSVSSCLNPDTRLKGISDFKTYTDYYCNKKCDMFCDGQVKDYFSQMNFDDLEKNNRKHYVVCNINNVEFDKALEYVKLLLSKEDKYTNYLICDNNTVWCDVAKELNIETVQIYTDKDNERILNKKLVPKTFNLITNNETMLGDLESYKKRMREKIIVNA